jgi:hypothetical protein
MTLKCVENKKPHCQIPIQQRGGTGGKSPFFTATLEATLTDRPKGLALVTEA